MHGDGYKRLVVQAVAPSQAALPEVVGSKAVFGRGFLPNIGADDVAQAWGQDKGGILRLDGKRV